MGKSDNDIIDSLEDHLRAERLESALRELVEADDALHASIDSFNQQEAHDRLSEAWAKARKTLDEGGGE